MYYSVMNAGTIALFGVGALIMVLSLFWNAPTQRPQGKAAENAGKTRLCAYWRVVKMVLLALLVIGTVLALWLSVLMARAAARPVRDGVNYTVVVLGCQTKDGKPSQMLARRLDSALAYLREHPKSAVVVSGGGEDDGDNEAAVMARYLEHQGIEHSRIYQEASSSNTEENLAFSMRLIQEHGLPRDLAIASDGFHILRGFVYAKKSGAGELSALASATPGFLLPVYWVREWMGLCKAVL